MDTHITKTKLKHVYQLILIKTDMATPNVIIPVATEVMFCLWLLILNILLSK